MRLVLLALLAIAVVVVAWYIIHRHREAALDHQHQLLEQQRRAAFAQKHNERLLARVQAETARRESRTRLHELVRMSRSVVAPPRVPPTLPHFQPRTTHTPPSTQTPVVTMVEAVHAPVTTTTTTTITQGRWWDQRENYETPDTREQIELLLSSEDDLIQGIVQGDTRASAVFRSDSENVMDDTVVRDMKRIISKIRANPTKCHSVSAETLVSDLQTEPTGEPAYKAAAKMMKPTCRIGFGINMSCRDVLDLVWKQVNDPRYNTRELKEILKTQLVDGSNRCPHGKVARSLSVFSGIDDELTLRSTGFLNREMMDTASAMAAQRDDDGSDEADAVFRDQLRARFHNDYVDTGVMSRKNLEKELLKWIEYV